MIRNIYNKLKNIYKKVFFSRNDCKFVEIFIIQKKERSGTYDKVRI
ncbi:hypothetical protein EDC37_106148 [Pectinatus cerevisiiphilus]|uniref:Uncharacterized protein n=1 Tax=Pectinatus cerevisiiphilus TaxID=86956 RepID=A0A4R3KAQ6_9FIRM|nr:hypothetical protein EDC37_106148 [Pectinatus cerevisiiphilus]